ncbi:MAG: ArsR family transcriptional regulator [Candidatus Bathyarchaeia archaeon]
MVVYILSLLIMMRDFILRYDGEAERIKEIKVFNNPRELRTILSPLCWQIIFLLSEREMYPLEIARTLNINEQRIYYHIRKLLKAGVIIPIRQEERKGAIARYYKTVFTAFGVDLPIGYRSCSFQQFAGYEKVKIFFREFILEDGSFNGHIVVGCPMPHGPFKTTARDGHYASHLTFFLGQFIKMPKFFSVKLDVDVKAEKEEKNNLILVGGPGTNLLTQEVNECLPVKFNMHPSNQGFLFGGLISQVTSKVYNADSIGLIAKIINPWDKNKRIIVLAGNKAVGTKACVLAITNFWEKTLQDYNGEDQFVKVIQGFDLDGDGKVDSIDILE